MSLSTVNFILIVGTILFLIFKDFLFRVEIGVDRTLWRENPIGVTLWVWNNKRSSTRSLISFSWVNREKAMRKDQEWQEKQWKENNE